MVPPSLLEYVAVHELAHLVVRNHSPYFWNPVIGALPARRRLRETSPHLPPLTP